MELQPPSPALAETLRSGPAVDGPPTPTAEARPVTNYRVNLARTQSVPADEVLIPDQRAGLTPAQSVERKLTALLRGSAIPASHLRLAKLNRRR
jgi:hypothetical protein